MKRITGILMVILILFAAGTAYAYELPLTLEEAKRQLMTQSKSWFVRDSVLYDRPEENAKEIGTAGIGEETEVYAVNVNDGFAAVMTQDAGIAYVRNRDISMSAPTIARDEAPNENSTDDIKNGYPGEAYNDEKYLKLITEAKKYIGMPYVWGGSTPETSFDCSGYVCWALNETGLAAVGRTNAQGLYDVSERIEKEDIRPGDLVFFEGTYSAAWPVTHVAIYVGNQYMLHAGKPIGYSRMDTPYWQEHFYGFGRIY